MFEDFLDDLADLKFGFPVKFIDLDIVMAANAWIGLALPDSMLLSMALLTVGMQLTGYLLTITVFHSGDNITDFTGALNFALLAIYSFVFGSPVYCISYNFLIEICRIFCTKIH